MTKQIDTRLKRLEERLIHMWPEESQQEALAELAALLGVKPEQMPPAPDAEIAKWGQDQICQRQQITVVSSRQQQILQVLETIYNHH